MDSSCHYREWHDDAGFAGWHGGTRTLTAGSHALWLLLRFRHCLLRYSFILLGMHGHNAVLLVKVEEVRKQRGRFRFPDFHEYEESSIGECVFKETLDLFLVGGLTSKLKRVSASPLLELLGQRTLLPVATELLGSRPAYVATLPLWNSVCVAAVCIRGAT
jgi:hypothetical protein